MTLRKRVLEYFIKTLNGMAYGLFATLIISVIIRQLGILTSITAFTQLADILRSLMGVGIGVGIAWSLNLSGLKLIAGAMAGGIATGLISPDPVVAYLTVIAAIEGVRFILRKNTPFDILLIPLLTVAIAYFTTMLIGPPVASFMTLIGQLIQNATALQPFLMGIVIAVIMGMALTSPISSAAIAISIGLSGIAGGAAVVGGAVQMLGFAIMSRKDNSIGTVISVAVGTSMLQFKNILRKPIIWLPTIIVSMILGPISTVLFKMETQAVGSGMGTSSFVGQIATLNAMGGSSIVWIKIAVLHILLPIGLVFMIDFIFRLKGIIKEGDLSLKTE